jgi:dsDNA-binding SOS-regulon protein
MDKKKKLFLSKKTFERIGAAVIGVLAICLVYSNSIDSALNQEIILKNVERANAFSFFLAKRIRQAINQAIYTSLFDMPSQHGQRNEMEQKSYEEHKLKIKHLIESFNDKNNAEGRTKLLQKASQLEEEISRSIAQESDVGLAVNFYQVAIILASISLIIFSPTLLLMACMIGFIAIYFHILGVFF